jgi:large subunit ribosomal protein L17
MAVIELVREPIAKKAVVKEAAAATKRAAKDADKAETKPAKVADLPADDAVDATESVDAPAKDIPAGALAANEDGSSPDADYTVKGNGDSGKYHVEGSQWYDATIAEFWFKSAEDAEAAGFEPAGGAAKQQVEDSDEA